MEPLSPVVVSFIKSTTGKENAILINGERVDDGIVTREVLDKLSFGTFPFLDVVWRSRSKGEFGWMQGESAHGFLVMRERRSRFSCRQVPEFDGGIV